MVKPIRWAETSIKSALYRELLSGTQLLENVVKRAQNSSDGSLGQRQAESIEKHNRPKRIGFVTASIYFPLVSDITEQAVGISADKRMDKRRSFTELASGLGEIFSR